MKKKTTKNPESRNDGGMKRGEVFAGMAKNMSSKFGGGITRC